MTHERMFVTHLNHTFFNPCFRAQIAIKHNTARDAANTSCVPQEGRQGVRGTAEEANHLGIYNCYTIGVTAVTD